MREHFSSSVHTAEKKGIDCSSIFLLNVLCKIFQCFLLIASSIFRASTDCLRYALLLPRSHPKLNAKHEFLRGKTSISHTKTCFHRLKRFQPISRGPSNLFRYAFSLKENKSSVAVFYTFLLMLQVCDALQFLDAKPISSRETQQKQVHFHPVGPRVLMPPLDLGFRGQTSNQLERERLLNGYQSDESSAYDAEIERGNNIVDQTPSRLRMTGGRAYDAGTINFSSQRKAFRTSKSVQRPYYDSAYPQPLQSYPTGPYEQPNYYYPYGRRTMNYETNAMYPDKLQYDFQYRPNTWKEAHPGAASNGYRQSYASQYSQQSPYAFHNDPRGYSEDYAPPNNRQPSFFDLRTQGQTRSIGHESNYAAITDDEIEKHVQNYHEKAYMSLPNLPALREGSPHDIRQDHPEKNHLVMRGNLAHDHAAQRFAKTAGAYASPEVLFDEIDTDKDGVIRIEELRNFLWLHEVAAAPG